MKNKSDINSNASLLSRYYRGETTLEEERQLRSDFWDGQLPDDPILAFRNKDRAMPSALMDKIRSDIRRIKIRRIKRLCVCSAATAATMILIIMLRGFLNPSLPDKIQLSDNVKKQRFEDALRVIGNTLDEKATNHETIIYEDNNLIISVE